MQNKTIINFAIPLLCLGALFAETPDRVDVHKKNLLEPLSKVF
jgi:hypothetical protein